MFPTIPKQAVLGYFENVLLYVIKVNFLIYKRIMLTYVWW